MKDWHDTDVKQLEKTNKENLKLKYFSNLHKKQSNMLKHNCKKYNSWVLSPEIDCILIVYGGSKFPLRF